tara:strand:+ start:156 stop:1568 length:1413 start_codon:yes stop_codon:yes gene_type:complete
MTNQERRSLLDRFRASDMEGSILDVFKAYEQGVDLISEHEASQAQDQPVTLTGPQEQREGLRPFHAAGDVKRSAVFKDVPPNTPFNTNGMRVPIDIEKYDRQGHLVESHKSVPPGVRNLPTGPHRGDIIETPSEGYRDGGFLQKGGPRTESFVEDVLEMAPGIGTLLSLDDAYYAAKDMIKNPGKIGFNKRTLSNVLDMTSPIPGGKIVGSVLARTVKAGDKIADLSRVRNINSSIKNVGRAASADDLSESIPEELSRWSLPPEDAPKPLTPRPPKKLPKQGGRYSFQKGGARKDEDYNMKRALELGYKPDEDGHYPSVDHETGMLLKSKQHPTVKLEFMSQMLSPERKLVANPTGYFGDYQLQYVDRKKKGGAKDPVVGTGKKPKGSGRRLYTDENPKDTVGIKFATPADARATVSKVKNINKPFARKIQILTVGEQRAKVMGKDEVVSIFNRAKESLRARNKKFLKRK